MDGLLSAGQFHQGAILHLKNRLPKFSLRIADSCWFNRGDSGISSKQSGWADLSAISGRSSGTFWDAELEIFHAYDLSMPFPAGSMLYPLIPFAMILMKKGPVAKFYASGAISPETARRPQSIEAKGDLERAFETGMLIRLEDGRCYVNVGQYRRRRRLWTSVFIAALVVIGTVELMIWAPWRG